MDDRDTIRRRVVDRAVDLFNAKDSNGEGLFTTAHYGQAMKAEFKTPGPTLDGETCTKHLLEMGDIVEKAGGNLWQRRMPQVLTDNDTVEIAEDAGDEFMQRSIAWAEEAVLQLLTANNAIWWTVETASLELNSKLTSPLSTEHLANLVGCILYGMAVEGLVMAKRNVVFKGERRTVFCLAESANIKE